MKEIPSNGVSWPHWVNGIAAAPCRGVMLSVFILKLVGIVVSTVETVMPSQKALVGLVVL